MKHNFILPLHRHMESQPDADNGTKDVPCYDSAKQSVEYVRYKTVHY